MAKQAKRQMGQKVYSTDSVDTINVDTAGNVGIGTGSPAYKVDASLGNPSSSTLGLRLATGNIGNLILGMSQASTNMGTSSTSADIYTSAALDLRFGTNSSEKMRIDASGNVGIGTESPAEKMQVIGTVKASSFDFTGASTGVRGVVTTTSTVRTLSSDGTTYGYGISTNIAGGLDIMANQASQDIRFYCGTSNASPSERMRIDSSGALTIGPSSGLTAYHEARNQAAAGNTLFRFNKSTLSGGTLSSYFLSFGHGATDEGYIWHDASGNMAFANASDASLKENVRSITGLDKCLALRPVMFDWKDGTGKDNLGFIAQEVEQVLPKSVGLAPDGETKMLSLSSEIIPVLVAAIQELSAKNDALEARIAALESK